MSHVASKMKYLVLFSTGGVKCFLPPLFIGQKTKWYARHPFHGGSNL